MEPRYSDPRYVYNDVPGITMNVLCPGKSYSKIYGTEPQYNNLRCNDENLADRTYNLSRYNDIISKHSHNLSKAINFMEQHYTNRVISNVSVNLLAIGVLLLYMTLVTETLKQK